jgi:NAD(P)-dependent dehydrogenase (short-subunit alcohol dehydrogenase family)
MKILIAGATSGIGRFLAERLLEAGHNVWGFARSSEGALAHARFRAFACDVAEWDKVDQLASKIAAETQRLNAIIICAALQGPVGPAMTLDPKSWSAAVRVNLDGTFNVLRAFAALLRPGGDTRAKILCFSGGGASKPRANFSAYAASKTGVVRLVETLAEEWRGKAIDINSIAPGTLPTRMTEEILRNGAEAAGETEIAMARATLSAGRENFERLGGLVDFLLSPKSDGISGKLISALWDPWEQFGKQRQRLGKTDLLTLRRITPEDRGEAW